MDVDSVEIPLGHISSLPTTHELLNTKNKLQKKLDFVDDMLTEKLELGISVDVEDPSTSNSDVVIIPGQKSPDLKNIDLSCSDDCYCDRCIQVKYAMKNDATIDNCDQPFSYSTPISHSTPKRNVASEIDFASFSDDSFDLREVAKSYLQTLKSKVDRLEDLVAVQKDEEYLLKVVDFAEKSVETVYNLL